VKIQKGNPVCIKHHGNIISDIKWTRTDTVLDLSQKANKGEKDNRMVLDQQLKMRILILQE
jgi:hypothetical protein